MAILDIRSEHVSERPAATAAPEARPSADADRARLSHRVLSLVATLALFAIGFQSWGAPVQVPLTGALVALVYGAGLVLGVLAVTVRTERALVRVDTMLLALGLVALAAQATSALYQNPGYGTDEAAFEQAAATLLLHGHDPYGQNLLSALSQFRVPIQFATSTLNGGTVSTFGYPALSILVVAASVLITGGTQAVPLANMVILAVATIVMFKLLPRRLRSLAVIVALGLPLLFGFAASGVNAIICMALLLPVVWGWARVGTSGRLTRGQCLQAIALGLAISTQQLAWFVTPFVFVGLFLLRREQFGARRALRLLAVYAGWATAAFLVINGAFLVWSPEAWLHGVAAPLTQHAIPYGQGLVDLTLFLHVGGGNLRAYNDGAAAALAGLLVVYALNFRHLVRAVCILPVVPLFYSSRSLAEYFITLAAVMVVSVSGTDEGALGSARSLRLPRWLEGHRPGISVAALVPAVACLAVALVSPQPLMMRVVGLRTTGQLQTIWWMRVAVRNTSDAALAPRFATNSFGEATTFWNILSGPRQLAPHSSAIYQLAAPNVGSMAGINSALMLEAFTPGPATFSSTGLLTPEPYSATLLPSYINHFVSRSGVVTLQLQLRSPLGADVRRAGVRVALGQLIYDQSGLIFGQAQINHGAEGESPVFAETDSEGRATFHISDTAAQGEPIYFQAWVQPPGQYPYGYSELVSVLWR